MPNSKQNTVTKSKGFAHLVLILVVIATVLVGTGSWVYLKSKQESPVLGTNTTDPDRLYVINDTRICNAFNIMGGSTQNLTFHQSLQAILDSLNNYRNEPTSVLINRVGPWCQHEAHPAGSMPFAYNLFYKFIDRYAEYGGARYRQSSTGRWGTPTCKSPMPRKYPRPEDIGVSCSAFSLRANPGDPYFDYYRGMFTQNSGQTVCTLKTHAFPPSVGAPTIINTFLNDEPEYLGNYFNDSSNSDLYSLRLKQLKHLVYSAQERNINPYIVMGLWATESGFSNRASCFASNGSNPNPYPVTVRAYGRPDSQGLYPIISLRVRGMEVKRWTVNGTLQNYTHYVDTTDTSQIKVHFVNDNGPRDLYVEHMYLAGTYYSASDPKTYSVGSWTTGATVNPCGGGKKQTNWLVCNGYFWFNAP